MLLYHPKREREPNKEGNLITGKFWIWEDLAYFLLRDVYETVH